MSDLGFNVWGVVAGAISLFSLLPASAWIYSQFPSRKLSILEGVRDETVMLFRKGLIDGLHTHIDDIHMFCAKMWA